MRLSSAACREPESRPAQPEPEEHRGKRRGRHERAAQAVEKPPAVHAAKVLSAPEQPRKILPVSAHPALHPRIETGGGAGEAVGQLHVAEIAAAQIRALQRVGGEDAVFRYGAVAAGEQRVDVQNALSGKAAAVVAIHVELAAVGAVGVGAALTGKEAGKVCAHGALELHGHARMHQAVSLCHRAAPMVDHGRGEGMEHRADELRGRAGGEEGVAVEREQIPCPGEGFGSAAQETDVGFRSAQIPGKGEQRAALALVAAPHTVGLRERSVARKQEKAAVV